MKRSLLALVVVVIAIALALPLFPPQVRAELWLPLLAVGAFAAFSLILAMQDRDVTTSQHWPSHLRMGVIANVTEKIARAINDMTGMQYIGGGRASLDFGSLATILQARLTIPVTGALLGDFAQCAPETDIEAGLQISAWVSAADTVTVCCSNNTAGTIDPAADVYRVRVIREAKR